MSAGVRVALLVLLAGGLLPAKEKAYVGAKTCGACHPDRLAQQSGSGHAHALHAGAEHPLAKSFAPGAPLL